MPSICEQLVNGQVRVQVYISIGTFQIDKQKEKERKMITIRLS